MDSGKIDELNAPHNKIGRAEYKPELIEKYKSFYIQNFKQDIEENLKEDFIVRNRHSKWSNI